jgi:ATP-dependent Clp protease adapter protein ClpS
MSENPNQPQAETTPPPTAPVSEPAPEQAAEAMPALPPAAPAKKPRRVRRVTRRPLGKVRTLKQFCVVLHDDEHVEMTYVVRSIVELTPLSAPNARDAMLLAHEHGSATMLTTHLERAELYQEQFTSKGLTVTIEAAT